MIKKFRCDEAFFTFLNLKATLENNEVEYPATAIIHGNRNKEKLFSELAEYIKRRDEKINELANGTGLIKQDDKENLKKLNEYMEEYNQVEIEVDITMVPVQDFMKYSYHPNELIPFEFMIE